MNYYNDSDPKAVSWLRELIAAGHLPLGTVDERSVLEIKPSDLTGFDQCHFFAGIGGWPLALQMARWPAGAPVWTGSCPCQPLSVAGKRQGHLDHRHLWPDWLRLIRECNPPTVFGEQVASRDGLEWLDGVFADLENQNYACGAADLCAAGVGAPHIRQRLFWVANLRGTRLEERQKQPARQERQALERSGDAGRLGFSNGTRRNAGLFGATSTGHGSAAESTSRIGGLGDSTGRGCGVGGDASQPRSGGHPIGPGWSRFDLIPCRDGKSRRVESGTFPLAHGVSGRVGLLRGYGNAIVPQLGATFIAAFRETAAGLDEVTIRETKG